MQHSKLWVRGWKIVRMGLITFVLIAVALILSVQFYFIPNANTWKQDIASQLTQRIGHTVTIGHINAGWHAMHPHLHISDLILFDSTGNPSLQLGSVNADIAWSSLLLRELYLFDLRVDAPTIVIHRNVHGNLFVAGIEIGNNNKFPGSSFGDWLIHQRHLHITQAKILWQDDYRHAPPLILSHASLTVNNFSVRHSFAFSATPPAKLAQPFQLNGVFYGRSLESLSSWHGRVGMNFPSLDLSSLKTYVNYPFVLESGVLGGTLHAQLANRRLTELRGKVYINNLVAQNDTAHPLLKIDHLSTGLEYEARENAYSLKLDKLTLALPGNSSQHNPLSVPMNFFLDIAHQKGNLLKVNAQADHFDLDKMRKIAASLPLPDNIAGWLAQYRPQGKMTNVKLGLEGPKKELKLTRFETLFHNFGIEAVGKRPGFTDLSGELKMQPDSGILSVDSRKASVIWPSQWRAPILFDTIVGSLSWARQGNYWRVTTDGIHLTNANLIGSVAGSYVTNLHDPGYLDLAGNIQHCEARYIPSYLPLGIGAPVIDWLSKAIVAGQAKDAKVIVRGNLMDFPFIKPSSGKFSVEAHITGGRLDYASGWPALNNLVLDIGINNSGLRIDGHSGNVYRGELSQVKAFIPNLFQPDAVLTVTGQAKAPTKDLLGFIQHSPVNKMLGDISNGVQAQGDGKLSLTLQIPLANVAATHTTGTYQFINNRIQFSSRFPALGDVSGALNFTGTKAKIRHLHVRLFGEPARIDLDADTSNTKVKVSGQAKVEQVLQFADFPFKDKFSGVTDYQAQLDLASDGHRSLTLQSDLDGLSSSLPFPLEKHARVKLPLTIKINSVDGRYTTRAKFASGLMNLVFETRPGKSTRGRVAFNKKAVTLPQTGIELTGYLKQLDVDAWRSLILDQKGKSAVAFPLSDIKLSVDTLRVASHELHHVKFDLVPSGKAWSAQIKSDEMAGRVSYDPKGNGTLHAILTRLDIPHTGFDEGRNNDQSAKASFQTLPALDVTADDLILNNHHYGKMRFLAHPEGNNWAINNLTLENTDSSLQLSGVWDDTPLHSHSQADFTLNVHDIGHYLARIGHPDLVKGGKAKLTGHLSWAGPLMKLDFSTLTGKMVLSAEKGQFLQVDPGIGKLLGILSLQSLPSRFALDFHDIFSHGFAFDTIQSNLDVVRGVIHSDDFRMYGPSALVLMNGQTDLDHETQQIDVHVIPNVGNSISIGAAFLGGPVVGLTSLLLQKLLQDPLGRIVSYHYLITGNWDKPIVEKVSAAKASRASGEMH